MTQDHTLHGLNLGGWLILEKWMTPSVFRGTQAQDEWMLSRTADGRERIRTHRDTFIQESDFQWLATHGIELVRIPFGYWLFEPSEKYVTGVEHLDWAMQMAEKYHLKVLLDMHGLPGSQNGKIHSGKKGNASWFASERHRKASLDLCRQVAKRYGTSPALWGVEVINEPMPASVRDLVTLRRYYKQAYKVLDDILPADVKVVFSDAFMPLLMTGSVRGRRAVMDVHWYSLGEKWQRYASPEAYFRKVRRRAYILRWLQLFQPVIIGEWNMMMAAQSRQQFASSPRRALSAQHLQVQQQTYQSAAAHIYWSYKTEHTGSWNYRDVVEKGLISEVKK